LDADQLKLRSVNSSSLSLLGLVRHMAEVERSWFRGGFAGEQIAYLYVSNSNPDSDFDDVEIADAEVRSRRRSAHEAGRCGRYGGRTPRSRGRTPSAG
jgi:hypothetical protein